MISKSHPDNFSIIKAVTQTQFENCVTAFIIEKLSGCDFEIISKLDSYFLMTVSKDVSCEAGTSLSGLIIILEELGLKPII